MRRMANGKWQMGRTVALMFPDSSLFAARHSLFALSSQIHFDDPLVRRHLVDAALREHGAFMETGHLDAEFAHEGHVVLDHHHGVSLVDLLEQLGREMRL